MIEFRTFVCACQIYHELSWIRRSVTFKAQWKCYRTIKTCIYSILMRFRKNPEVFSKALKALTLRFAWENRFELSRAIKKIPQTQSTAFWKFSLLPTERVRMKTFIVLLWKLFIIDTKFKSKTTDFFAFSASRSSIRTTITQKSTNIFVLLHILIHN